MYDWVTLLYSRNWHNSINQLYFKKCKKKWWSTASLFIFQNRRQKTFWSILPQKVVVWKHQDE